MDYQLQKNIQEDTLEALKLPISDSYYAKSSRRGAHSTSGLYNYIQPNLDQEEIEDTRSRGMLSSNSKRIKKNTEKREKYNLISNEVRLELIDAVMKRGEKMNHAAKRLGINYSSAKSIFQVYKKEGRADKKSSKKEIHRTKSYEKVLDDLKIQSINSTACSVSTNDGLQISQNNSSPISEQFEDRRIESSPFNLQVENNMGETISSISTQTSPNKNFQTSNSAFSKYVKKDKENNIKPLIQIRNEEAPRYKPIPLSNDLHSKNGLYGNNGLESMLSLMSTNKSLQNAFYYNLINNQKHNILPFEHQI